MLFEILFGPAVVVVQTAIPIAEAPVALTVVIVLAFTTALIHSFPDGLLTLIAAAPSEIP